MKLYTRFFLLLSAVWIMISGLTSCSSTTSDQSSQSGNETSGYSFIDDLGRKVELTSHKKVAALSGSYADMWKLAGGNVAAATKDAWTYPDAKFSENVLNVGTLMSVNTETLISAGTDFIIASANLNSQVELKDTFAQAGIPVAYFDVNNFKDYLRVFKILTNITGDTDAYKKYGTDVKKEVDAAIEKSDVRHPKILYLRASADRLEVKGSKGNTGSEMLKELGCENIADSNTSLLENLSMEAIITANPDYIFITTQGENTDAALATVNSLVLSNPAWNSLDAIKNKNYHILDKNLYNAKPNAKWGYAYGQLADILYGKD